MSSPLPVMLFLPGGAFQILDGSISTYNSERYVNTTNVIAVFAQYRLGKSHIQTNYIQMSILIHVVH